MRRSAPLRLLYSPDADIGSIPAFTPDLLPLAGWWDPDAPGGVVISAGGGTVALLADRSGLGNDLVQTDPSLRPSFAPASVNGRATVTTAAGATQYLLGGGPLGLGSAWELYAVVEYANYAVADSNEVVAFAAGGGGMLGFAGGQLRIGRSRVAWDVTHGTPLSPGPHVVGWRRDASGAYVTYLDGADGGAATAAQSVAAPLRLGPEADGAAACRYGEIVVTSAALSFAERAALHAYLKGRWNTP